MTKEEKDKKEKLVKALRQSKNAVEYLRAQANIMEAYPDHDNVKLMIICTLERYKCDHCPKTHNNPAMSIYIDNLMKEQIGADYPATGLLESCKAMIINNMHGVLTEEAMRESIMEDEELEEVEPKKDHVH